MMTGTLVNTSGEGACQTEEGYFPGLVVLDKRGKRAGVLPVREAKSWVWETFGKASKKLWQGIQQLKKEKQGIALIVLGLGGEILI